MISRTHAGLLVCVVAAELVECERGRSAVATAPSPEPVPSTRTLISFAQPDRGLSISELQDVREQVVHLRAANELIWTDDGTLLPGYRVDRSGYPGLSVIYANVTGDKQNDIEVLRC